MNNIFIFLFFVLFSFGQIIRLSVNFAGFTIPVQPIDIIVGLGAVYAVIRRLKKPAVFRYLLNFLVAAGFSFLVSIFIFRTWELFYGFFYLLRLAAYTYFLIYVFNFVKKKTKNGSLLANSLLGVSVVSGVFGWIQFFMVPDIKALFVYGWDIHLFRVVGTFLDPSFLGLIIVFGLLLSFNRFIDGKRKVYLTIAAFLLVSLAFTYSRASYLALIAGIAVLSIFKKKVKYVFYTVIGLVLLIIFLPTSRNHSIEFFRSFSAIARVENYAQTLNISKKFPLTGIGFDNLCIAKNRLVSIESFSSHACSGSDSSLLFILVTVGVLGLMIFISTIISIGKLLKRGFYYPVLISAFAAVLIHSLFSNSLFYPWVMGYMVMLLALVLKE